MKTYTICDIINSIRKVGIDKGDTIFIAPEIYKFGILENIQFDNELYETFFKAIKKIMTKGNNMY